MSDAPTISFKEYSLTSVDLISGDEYDDDEDPDYRGLEYCRIAATLKRADIMAGVLEELDAEDSPLYDLIDRAIGGLHEPGRPRESLDLLARVESV